MAIALRGTPTTGSAINGGNITLSLPAGMAQGDVVIVGFAMNAAGTGGTSSPGWTQIGANVTNTTRIQIFRKVMGSSPDASIVLTGTTAAADASTAIAIAFSGCDQGSPEAGVALTSATGSSVNPDPPAITPRRDGSAVIFFAATSIVDVTGTAAPANYTDFAQTSGTDTNSCSCYLAWRSGRSSGVSEDPGAVSGVSTAAWAAYTIAVAPPPTTPDVSIGPNIPPAYLRKAALTAACVAAFAGLAPQPNPTPQVVNPAIVGWQHATAEYPAGYLKKVLPTAAIPSVAWPPQVPKVEWTSRFGVSDQVHRYEPAKRSVELLGDTTIWAPPAPAAPVVTPTDLGHVRWTNPPPAPRRSVHLLGSPIWAPQVPLVEWTASFGVADQVHRYEPAKRSVNLLGAVSTWPAQAPPPIVYQEGWRSSFGEPPKAAPRSVALLGQVVWPAQVANVEYQDGWRSRFPDRVPAALRPVQLGQVFWSPRVPEVEYQDGWRSLFPTPPSYQQARRSVDLLGQAIWPAQVGNVQYQDGWRSRFTDPPKLPPRSVDLLGQAIWSAQVANVEYQDGWRQEFSKPVRLTAQPRLEGFVVWPGIGYSFVPTATPSELARQQWGDPPKAAQRSVGLLGQPVLASRVAEVEYQDGWRSKWQEPPKAAQRSTRLLGNDPVYPYQPPTVQVTVTTEMWHNRWPEPPKVAQRSVSLLGAGSWARVPNVEYVNGWFAQWEDPPAYDIDVYQYLADGNGDYIFSDTGDLIQLDQSPIAYRLPPERTVYLLGQPVWAARVPDVQYQDGWRSKWQEPPKAAPRSVKLFGNDTVYPYQPPLFEWTAGFGFSDQVHRYEPARRSVQLLGGVVWSAQPPVVQVTVTTEMWHQRWPTPPKAPARSLQLFGQTVWAINQGLPVTTPTTLWWPTWQLRPIPKSAPASIYQFDGWRNFQPPPPTPTIWWRIQWTDPPKAKARAVYLGDDSWASWAPQFIIQVVPTPPLVGVSFTFGVKTGPSAVPGTKPGATLQSQRKGGGFSLITRVKPRIS